MPSPTKHQNQSSAEIVRVVTAIILQLNWKQSYFSRRLCNAKHQCDRYWVLHPCKISLLKGDESCRDDVDVTGDSRRIASTVKLNRFVITKISNSFHVFIYQEFKLHNIISPQLLFFLDNFTSSPATRTIHSHDCIETKVDLNKTYKNQPK